ncbi:MAG: hypothetical protein PHW01_01755 [Patescibacteria group bacterium]|nr:hypothetical protein [Patescibacteria group bacterium]
MRDLNTLNSEEITRPEVLQEVNRQVGEIIYFCEDKEAFKLSREFKEVLQRRELSAKPEILGQLKKWATLVNYVSLPAQRDSEIIQLFQGEIKEVLPLDEEIVLGRLEALLWVNPTGPREELCKKLVQALRDNRQKIGSLTIGEWLALFIHSYPGRPQLLELEERDFLNKNTEVQKLAEGDKIILAKLLKLYNALQPLGVMAEMEMTQEQGVSIEERKQVRLGQALAQTASEGANRPPQGYQGPQDLRDIRPANGETRFPQAQNRAPLAAETPSPSASPSGPLRRSFSEASRGSVFLPPQDRGSAASSPYTAGAVSKQPASFAPPTTEEIKRPAAFAGREEPLPSQTSVPNEPTDLLSQRMPEPPTPSISPSGRGSVTPAPNSPFQKGDGFSSPLLNKNFVQSEKLVDTSNSEITISILEAAAQKGDPVEEGRLRQIIRQNFNQLSPEVRSYIVNSPFWAE